MRSQNFMTKTPTRLPIDLLQTDQLYKREGNAPDQSVFFFHLIFLLVDEENIGRFEFVFWKRNQTSNRQKNKI